MSDTTPRTPVPAVAFQKGLSVLAIGPHVDDIEIGCGGTLLRLIEEFDASVSAAVFSNHYSFPRIENREEEARAASAMIGYDEPTTIFQYKDTEFPDDWRSIQDHMRTLRQTWKPQLVFAPNPRETHQDHQTVAQAVQREFRYGELLWHYEIHQFGRPNYFDPTAYVILDGDARQGREVAEPSELQTVLGKAELDPTYSWADKKVMILRKCMRSQLQKPLLQPELLYGLMRIRGLHAGPYCRYAEGFESRSIIY